MNECIGECGTELRQKKTIGDLKENSVRNMVKKESRC